MLTLFVVTRNHLYPCLKYKGESEEKEIQNAKFKEKKEHQEILYNERNNKINENSDLYCNKGGVCPTASNLLKKTGHKAFSAA